MYRKLSLDSNSNCSIIASANGVFDHNGGILESADTGVSLTVPEGAISKGCTFDLYFKVCHCKSNITNGKGELLMNPIVMCGPRGIRFLKPIELQIPHFISIDGQSWSYAFKASENVSGTLIKKRTALFYSFLLIPTQLINFLFYITFRWRWIQLANQSIPKENLIKQCHRTDR